MKIDVHASQPHYADHLLPIWHALPDETRGTFWTSRSVVDLGTPLPARLKDAGDCPILVAGDQDGSRFATMGRPLILLEHGAGQSYRGDPMGIASGSYSGGPGWDRCVLFLTPSEAAAQRWRDAYPGSRAVAVGCPKLDAWHRGDRRRPDNIVDRPSGRQLAVFTWHWECALVPETRSAWSFYRSSMESIVADLRDAGYDVAGHAHPRWNGPMTRFWSGLGVQMIDHLDEVFATADVLVADNTSALYEFASLGRPVVVLNAPWYRRDVEHGLRFWSAVPGVQVDRPEDVVPAVRDALVEAAFMRDRPHPSVDVAYVACDGKATARAVAAIGDVLGIG